MDSRSWIPRGHRECYALVTFRREPKPDRRHLGPRRANIPLSLLRLTIDELAKEELRYLYPRETKANRIEHSPPREGAVPPFPLPPPARMRRHRTHQLHSCRETNGEVPRRFPPRTSGSPLHLEADRVPGRESREISDRINRGSSVSRAPSSPVSPADSSAGDSAKEKRRRGGRSLE